MMISRVIILIRTVDKLFNFYWYLIAWLQYRTVKHSPLQNGCGVQWYAKTNYWLILLGNLIYLGKVWNGCASRIVLYLLLTIWILNLFWPKITYFAAALAWPIANWTKLQPLNNNNCFKLYKISSKNIS